MPAVTPGDWLQFGAMGLLALVLVGCLGIVTMVARALIQQLTSMAARLDTLAEAVLLLKDPSVRSYLTELRNLSHRPPAGPHIRERDPVEFLTRDTPVEGRKRGRF